jgi:hypothetical protein
MRCKSTSQTRDGAAQRDEPDSKYPSETSATVSTSPPSYGPAVVSVVIQAPTASKERVDPREALNSPSVRSERVVPVAELPA